MAESDISDSVTVVTYRPQVSRDPGCSNDPFEFRHAVKAHMGTSRSAGDADGAARQADAMRIQRTINLVNRNIDAASEAK